MGKRYLDPIKFIIGVVITSFCAVTVQLAIAISTGYYYNYSTNGYSQGMLWTCILFAIPLAIHLNAAYSYKKNGLKIHTRSSGESIFFPVDDLIRGENARLIKEPALVFKWGAIAYVILNIIRILFIEIGGRKYHAFTAWRDVPITIACFFMVSAFFLFLSQLVQKFIVGTLEDKRNDEMIEAGLAVDGSDIVFNQKTNDDYKSNDIEPTQEPSKQNQIENTPPSDPRRKTFDRTQKGLSPEIQKLMNQGKDKSKGTDNEIDR